MITRKEINFSAYNQTNKPATLNFLNKVLIYTIRLFNTNITAFKLEFFERMLNFVRIIGLKILSNNKHIELISKALSKSDKTSYENRVSQSFIEFLYHFGIITFCNNKPVINNKYKQLIENNTTGKLINKHENAFVSLLTKKEERMINDFLFVKDLIQKYRNPNYKFQYIDKKKKLWELLIAEKKLDYEIRLSETLYNLLSLKIPQKIKSPFDEEYYTESGQNAFKNFTKFRFLDYFKKITRGKSNINVFDLGCGHGNYIEVLNDSLPDCSITGIERNTKVFSSTHKKFEKNENIKIINNDFFDYTPKLKYDTILMNYVLFYFSFSEKKKILEKAKSIITDKGSIILCQYFSGIENLKKELAKKQNDYTVSKKIEMHYSNKILYANTLWNDAVDTFSEAVKWNEFKEIISELNLQIVSMTNADKFYYSLFIELKRNK